MHHDQDLPPRPDWYDEEWVSLLRAAVDRLGVARAATLIRYSTATVSTVLGGTYPANPKNVRRRVIEVFGADEVECPVLGLIPLRDCAEHRQRPFAASNPQRVRLWRACRTCVHNPNREDDGH